LGDPILENLPGFVTSSHINFFWHGNWKTSKQINEKKMRKLLVPLAVVLFMSSCIVEVDMTPSHILVGNINEYESKEVINEIWSGNVLVYEDFVYRTFLEIEFINTGGNTARNVWAEVDFYNGGYHIKTTSIRLPKIYSGDRHIYEFDSGFESLYDYTEYQVSVYWD
jgi:hypothetical protein